VGMQIDETGSAKPSALSLLNPHAMSFSDRKKEVRTPAAIMVTSLTFNRVGVLTRRIYF
jgi:hypothetical protein